MKYKFEFYNETYYDDVERLILASYQWDYPAYGISRMHFSHGLHPQMHGIHNAWQRSCGIFKLEEQVVACVINEGEDCGDVFFLFDSEARSKEKELIHEMIHFAKMYGSTVDERRGSKRHVTIMVPSWNKVLMECTLQSGFVKEEYQERVLIRPFEQKPFSVELPEGYSFVDGNQSSAIIRSIVHSAGFHYGLKSGKNADLAFEELRNEKNYGPDLDLVILDAQNRPVAMAIIWMNANMPYCELEPLCVAWWERRKGLATQILNEASNRVMKKYNNCKGMTGGDQEFYEKIGFESKGTTEAYRWEVDVYPSWDAKSKDIDYRTYL